MSARTYTLVPTLGNHGELKYALYRVTSSNNTLLANDIEAEYALANVRTMILHMEQDDLSFDKLGNPCK